MNDIDMSRPGNELFPDATEKTYNSYQDVNMDQVVGDPLDMGVRPDAASQEQVSDKEYNFKALREETAKLKEEREYWRGQAEAASKMNYRQPESPKEEQPSYESIDWDDGNDVKKAFNQMRQENERLRYEIKDALAATKAQSQYQNWDNMVSQHVPQLTSKNPIFAEMIKNASNPYEAAYLLAELNAKASQQGTQSQALPQPTQAEINAQRALSNASKPHSLSSIGGRGQLSASDYYATMSDKDFMEMAAKNLAGI